MIEQFFLSHRWNPNMYYLLLDRVVLGVIAMRIRPYSPKLQDCSLTIRLFSVIFRTLVVVGVLPF